MPCREITVRCKPDQRIVSLTGNGPIVILAGAGLSKSVGLPLQRELLEAVVPRDIIRIHNYFMGADLDAPADIETFLSSIDFDALLYTSARSGQIGTVPRVSAARTRGSPPPLNSRIFLTGFCFYLLERMAGIRRQRQFWRRLTAVIKAADSILTTNWDTLLEIQIRALGLGVSYFTPRVGCKQLLKLHGSIDWWKIDHEFDALSKDDGLFCSVFRGHFRYRLFSEASPGGKILGVPKRVAALFNKAAPAIIAPTHLKEILHSSLRRIWSVAGDVLHFAKQVLIIGYSLPPSDILVRLLLSNSLRYRLREDAHDPPQVTIVDPDPEGVVSERYHEVLGPRVRFIRERFLDVEFIEPPHK